MSVSKRLRFEILRRDNHACRYCGQMAPGVKLTVDHVHPAALGGSDDPTNLVTACVECNAGKTSLTPDSAIVADVAQDALRWAKAIELAAMVRRIEWDEVTEFLHAWEGWWIDGPRGEKRVIPIEPAWRESVEMWTGRGLTIDDLIELIPTAMRNRKHPLKNIKPEDRWRYFCGVVWRTLDKLAADARRIIEQDLDSDIDLGDVPATPFEAGEY